MNPSQAGIAAAGRRRVPGLRREEVAGLVGIGVSWYTALESGDAEGVSEQTLLAVARALRLSESEQNYLLTLAGLTPAGELKEPSTLLKQAMTALRFPAYIITATWDILSCNMAFRRVWAIAETEEPFNAVERLFLDPRARAMHGTNFVANIAPVVAMLRSAVGRRPHLPDLQSLREKLIAHTETRELWDAYEVSDPQVPNICTIESPIGRFTYEALTLTDPGTTSGLVVQIPDDPSQLRLADAMNIR